MNLSLDGSWDDMIESLSAWSNWSWDDGTWWSIWDSWRTSDGSLSPKWCYYWSGCSWIQWIYSWSYCCRSLIWRILWCVCWIYCYTFFTWQKTNYCRTVCYCWYRISLQYFRSFSTNRIDGDSWEWYYWYQVDCKSGQCDCKI